MGRDSGKTGLLEADIASLTRALETLRDQHHRYPVRLEELLSAAGLGQQLALRVLESRKLRKSITLAAKEQNESKQSALEAWLAFKDDAEALAGSDQILIAMLDKASKNVGKAHSVSDLAKRLPAALQGSFKKQWNASVERRRLPPGVLAIRTSRTTLLFLQRELIGRVGPTDVANADTRPTPQEPPPASPSEVSPAPAPATDPREPAHSSEPNDSLGIDILAAFDRLDQAAGGGNYVLLADLRQELPNVERAHFDEALNALRRRRVLSLAGGEGRHERLQPEQLEAGIREEGRDLVYAQKRTP